MRYQRDEFSAGIDTADAALDAGALGTNELAAEAIRSLGELRLRVTGSSMLPAIWPGDVLWICRCGINEVGAGDIVLYTRQGRLFAHRVVAVSEAEVVTQGDAIAIPDPSVSASELLGRVYRVLREGKPIRLRSKLTLFERAAAMILRRSALAARFCARLYSLRHRTTR